MITINDIFYIPEISNNVTYNVKYSNLEIFQFVQSIKQIFKKILLQIQLKLI